MISFPQAYHHSPCKLSWLVTVYPYLYMHIFSYKVVVQLQLINISWDRSMVWIFIIHVYSEDFVWLCTLMMLWTVKVLSPFFLQAIIRPLLRQSPSLFQKSLQWSIFSVLQIGSLKNRRLLHNCVPALPAPLSSLMILDPRGTSNLGLMCTTCFCWLKWQYHSYNQVRFLFNPCLIFTIYLTRRFDSVFRGKRF